MSQDSMKRQAIRATVALLVAFLAISGASAYGSRKTLAVAPCKVTMTAKASSYSQVTYTSAFTSAFSADIFKKFCADGQVYTPGSAVEANALAIANEALATATAEAYNTICAKGTIAGSCSAGSWAGFSATATSTAIAKAVAQSYASAIAQVIGAQAYALVKAQVTSYANALQSVCEQALLTTTTNGMLSCVKTTKTCTCQTTCPLCTTQCIVPSSTTCKNCMNCQPCPCYQMECTFTRSDRIQVIAEASAQAIAQAIALVTSTPGQGVCTYDGNVQTCTQFEALCNAVCNPEEGLCVYPETTITCPDNTGPWVEVADGSYRCQPICEGEQVPSAYFTGGNAAWTCADPPATLKQPLTRTTYSGYFWDVRTWFDDKVPTSSIEVTSIPQQVLAQMGSKKWVGQIVSQVTATYEFFTSSDDASYVYIGNTLVVNNGGLHIVVSATGSFTMTAGVLYDFEVIAGNNYDPGTVIVNWRKAGDTVWQNDLSPLLPNVITL